MALVPLYHLSFQFVNVSQGTRLNFDVVIGIAATVLWNIINIQINVPVVLPYVTFNHAALFQSIRLSNS